MNLQGEKTSRASQQDMGWRAQRTCSLLPVAGKVFLLTLPFIERLPYSFQYQYRPSAGFARIAPFSGHLRHVFRSSTNPRCGYVVSVPPTAGRHLTRRRSVIQSDRMRRRHRSWNQSGRPCLELGENTAKRRSSQELMCLQEEDSLRRDGSLNGLAHTNAR